MYRLQDNVPTYLINESRDFQLLCRLYDCVNNGVKFSIDSIVRVMDTTSCGSGFLRLLETRLGFFTSGNYTDDEIRDVLMGFCDAVRYKGSKLGVSRAVRLFLMAKNLKVETRTDYKKEDMCFYIGFRTSLVDTSLLTDILRYILPAGSGLSYFYYKGEPKETYFNYGDRVTTIIAPDRETGRIVSVPDFYTDAEYADKSGAKWDFNKFNESTVDSRLDKDAVDNSLSNLGLTSIYSNSFTTEEERDNASKIWEIRNISTVTEKDDNSDSTGD